ncbi:hypothetical protein FKM82_027173 [Ascaphus truei]
MTRRGRSGDPRFWHLLSLGTALGLNIVHRMRHWRELVLQQGFVRAGLAFLPPTCTPLGGKVTCNLTTFLLSSGTPGLNLSSASKCNGCSL